MILSLEEVIPVQGFGGALTLESVWRTEGGSFSRSYRGSKRESEIRTLRKLVEGSESGAKTFGQRQSYDAGRTVLSGSRAAFGRLFGSNLFPAEAL